MATPRIGLRVAYFQCPCQQGHGRNSRQTFAQPGWYIAANVSGEWMAYLPMRFLREQDAKMAAKSLTDAGLNSGRALYHAGPVNVSEVACADLQW